MVPYEFDGVIDLIIFADQFHLDLIYEALAELYRTALETFAIVDPMMKEAEEPAKEER